MNKQELLTNCKLMLNEQRSNVTIDKVMYVNSEDQTCATIYCYDHRSKKHFDLLGSQVIEYMTRLRPLYKEARLALLREHPTVKSPSFGLFYNDQGEDISINAIAEMTNRVMVEIVKDMEKSNE